MTRIRSLSQLGKGAWKVAAITPVSSKPRQKLYRSADSVPHQILWSAMQPVWPRAVREHQGAVPGRRFRIDIAFVGERLAIEVDGWTWHGKFLNDFKRDRERQNLLTIHGWRILRFTAGEIHGEIEQCLAIIRAALAAADRP